MSANLDLIADIRERLAAAADPERATGQQAYMKSAMPFRGLATPERRRLVGDAITAHPVASRDEWVASVRTLWDEAAYREERYAATQLLRHRTARAWWDRDLLPLLRHMVVTGAWWDHVDELSHTLGAVLAGDNADGAITRTVQEWARDDDMWVRRIAILSQLDFRRGLDADLLTDCIDANLLGSRHGSEFFIRKAIGWALRQHARVEPDWVRAFVATRADSLSPLSKREALKHLV
ncbi:MAG: DNA alkylation repair protein [Micrococcales bacterium]|nr:DNA alkylation repair protein [Micrococcales bacterium]